MSIMEIAREANVSVSTVSRFFNKPETVRPKIAEKIRLVAEKIDYQPKAVRPGPKGAERIGIKTGAIALVSLDEFAPADLWNQPAWPVLIGSMQTVLSKKQLSLFLDRVDTSGRLPDCVSPKYCDGVVFFSKSNNPELAANLKKKLADIPAVWCFREHMDEEHLVDHIFYDNSVVGVIAADYLASNKHKKVAVFSSSYSHPAFLARVETFGLQAEKLGMKVEVFQTKQSNEVPVRYRFQELANEFLKREAGITGAFFCVDQDMLGIYTELLGRGYPAKLLDMVGCNRDETVLQYISPRPSTIDIKIAQIGQMAVDQLLRRINGDFNGAASEIFIKPELIRGDR